MTLDLFNFFPLKQAAQYEPLQTLLNAHFTHLEQPVLNTLITPDLVELIFFLIVSNWGTDAKYSELDKMGKSIRQIILNHVNPSPASVKLIVFFQTELL